VSETRVKLTTLQGGLLPLIPYFIFRDYVLFGLYTSIGVTGIVLLAFGFIKSKLAGTDWKDAIIGAVQTLILGSAAAGVAYAVVQAVNSDKGL
jgi:vacuolar iron transporter family protein